MEKDRRLRVSFKSLERTFFEYNPLPLGLGAGMIIHSLTEKAYYSETLLVAGITTALTVLGIDAKTFVFKKSEEETIE